MGIQVNSSLNLRQLQQDRQLFKKHLEDLQKMANENSIKIKMDNVAKDINSANSSIENMNKGLGSTIERVAKITLEWLSVRKAIELVEETMKDAVDFTTQLDTKLTNISMITQENKNNLQGYAKEWNKMAVDMKVDTNDVVDSMQELLRAGKGLEESKDITKTVLELSRVSDENTKIVSNNMVKIGNAYHLNAESLRHVGDMLSDLDTKTAANTKDMMNSVVTVAQTAQQTGTSLEYLMGLVSTIQEKSKIPSSAVGKQLRNIFLNLEQIQHGKGIEGISKLEDKLEGLGTHLRKSNKEWESSEVILKNLQSVYKNLDSVTQSEIQNLIAKKENAETFNIIMQDSARVIENTNSALKSNGNLSQKYQEHLNSVQGSINELKSVTEGLYMNLIVPSAVEKGIKSLTETVKLLSFVVTDFKSQLALGIGASSILIIKNLDKVKFALGEVGAFLSLLRTEGLEAFNLFNMFNPVTAIITLISATTLSFINNQKQLKEHTDELTSSFKNLSQAMRDNNKTMLESEVDKLSKEQEKINEIIKKRDAVKGDFHGKLIFEKQLKDEIAILEKSGYAFDENTNQIKLLSKAKLQLENMNIADKIKQEAQATLNGKNELKGLMAEYLRLNTIEDKNAKIKERMTQLSEELSGKIEGLKVSRDKEGNAVVVNTDLLKTNIKILNEEGNTLESLTNSKLQNAKIHAQVEFKNTKLTYEQVTKRIEMYRLEKEALEGSLKARQQTASYFLPKNLQDPLANVLKGGVDSLTADIDILQGAKDKIDKIFKSSSSNNIDIGTEENDIDTKNTGGNKKDKTYESYESKSDIMNPYLAKLEQEDELLKEKNNTLESINKKLSQDKSIDNTEGRIKALQTEDELYKAQLSKLDQLNKSKQVYQDTEKELISNLASMNINANSDRTLVQIQQDFDSQFGGDRTFSNKNEKEDFDQRKKEAEGYISVIKKIREGVLGLNKDINDVSVSLSEISKDKLELQFKNTNEGLEKIKTSQKLINQELDIYNEKTVEGYGKKIEIHKKLNDSLLQENKYVKDTISSLELQRDKLSPMSVEWGIINKEVETYKDKLQSSNMEVIKNAKAIRDLALNEFDKALEQSVYKGTRKDFENKIKAENDLLQDRLNKMKEENDLEKQRDEINKKIQEIELIKSQIDAIKNNKLKDMAEEQAKALYLESEKEAIIKHQTDMLEKQKELQKELNTLDELKANRSIKQLRKDSSTNEFSFEFVADDKKIKEQQDKVDKINKEIVDNQLSFDKQMLNKQDSLNKSLADKQRDFENYEKELRRQHEEKLLEQQIKDNENQLKIRDDYYNLVKDKIRSNYDKENPESAYSIISGGFDEINKLNNGKMGTIISDIKSNVSLANNELSKLSSILEEARSMASQVASYGSSGGSGSSSGKFEDQDVYYVNTSIDADLLRKNHPDLNIGIDYGREGNMRGENREETLRMNEEKLKNMGRYKTGGENISTGLALLHGTANKPERVLNSDQTETFNKLVYKDLPLLKNLDFSFINNVLSSNKFIPNLATPVLNNNAKSSSIQNSYIFEGNLVFPNMDNQSTIKDFISDLNNKKYFVK